MDDSNIDYERECHWRMVSEENCGGVDDRKALLHSKRWYLYVNEMENIIKGGYMVEVVCHDRRRVIWELVDGHVLEEATDHYEIGLREFDFNILAKTRRG